MFSTFNTFVTTLEPDQRVVFGSNLAGIHGAGAARQAYEKFGAEWGVGEGPTGQCYAIPTKDENLQTRSLAAIQISVAKFCAYAMEHPELAFLVTPIGCGLAGLRPEQIGPMFSLAPENCALHTDIAPHAVSALGRFAEYLIKDLKNNADL